jgi:hypothetical protein
MIATILNQSPKPEIACAVINVINPLFFRKEDPISHRPLIKNDISVVLLILVYRHECHFATDFLIFLKNRYTYLIRIGVYICLNRQVLIGLIGKMDIQFEGFRK